MVENMNVRLQVITSVCAEAVSSLRMLNTRHMSSLYARRYLEVRRKKLVSNICYQISKYKKLKYWHL